MNEIELEFINDKKLDLNHFFDAKGNKLTEALKNEMREQNKIFAFNTAPCTKNNEHTLKSRNGHCIICNTSNIHYTLLNFNEGFVYIAGSISKKKIKIGATNNIEKREKYLNENKGYGNINDWKILYYVKSPYMGKNESAIKSKLRNYNEPPIDYVKDKEAKTATELYRCSYKKVYDSFIEHFGNKINFSKQIEKDFDKYKFPNLPY